ncbi:MAG: cellulase family glycosylhydrolase, partial [Muribaculaceae bacterium]|nr:cellulase family glycosylhydrolase [Muribaculaceae bacterium]
MKKSALVGCVLAGLVATANGLPGRYYGTNYTLPFAHGYRAAEILGQDRKVAIDQDVYHMARMGLNGFRLHLWEAELADSAGNLVDNTHLDLLDYLLYRLEQRGIAVILTAQPNFGNGYPERDTDTGAFTYDYDKCEMHSAPGAVMAQRRYIDQLVRHVNPYNGRSYAADTAIVALEINNEPCHTTSPTQIKEYIDTMVSTLRSAGWHKPILYNASHNTDKAQGYFDSAADGTTYQWYPIGLVSGKARRGNFLP